MKAAKRAEARKKWARVAAGEFDDPAIREWLQGVALRLLAADDLSDPDGNERPGQIVRAVDLSGSKRNVSGERAAIRSYLGIAESPLTQGMFGASRAERQKTLRRLVVDTVGLPIDDLDTAVGRDRIDARIRTARREGK